MVAEIDIWRTASVLIKHHGEGAISYAAGRAADLAVKGDQLSALTFKRIVEAIRELQRRERDQGEALN